MLRVLFADDSLEPVVAAGAWRGSYFGEPSYIHATRKGVAVRFDVFDGLVGKRVYRGGVAHIDGPQPWAKMIYHSCDYRYRCR